MADGIVYVSNYITFGPGDDLTRPLRDFIFVGALNAATGRLIWKVKPPGTTSVENGIAYVDSGQTFYALDAKTGQPKWKFDHKDYVGGGVVSNGIVYFESSDHHLNALDARTGETRWQFLVSGRIWPPYSSETPLLSADTIYFGTDDGHVYAVDAANGKEKWEYKFPNSVPNSEDASLTPAGGSIYFASGYDLFGLDEKNGKETLHYSEPGIYRVTADAGVLYFQSDDGNHQTFYLNALDTKSKQLIWKLKLDASLAIPPVAVDGVIYVALDNWLVYALQ